MTIVDCDMWTQPSTSSGCYAIMKAKSYHSSFITMQKLNVWGWAVTVGGIIGISTVLIGWWAGDADVIVNRLSEFYIGYAPSFVGGIVGGAWAFTIWTLIGAIFASIYNSFVGEK